MSEQDQKVLDITAVLWNEYLKIPQAHPDDLHDVRFHIHAIQNIIFAREPYLLTRTPHLRHGIPHTKPESDRSI